MTDNIIEVIWEYLSISINKYNMMSDIIWLFEYVFDDVYIYEYIIKCIMRYLIKNDNLIEYVIYWIL
jgi:hypothetical protein